jgi:hypothetical protein
MCRRIAVSGQFQEKVRLYLKNSLKQKGLGMQLQALISNPTISEKHLL